MGEGGRVGGGVEGSRAEGIRRWKIEGWMKSQFVMEKLLEKLEKN